MAKFLDESGLTQFAGKIDDKFARKTSLNFSGITSEEEFTVNRLGSTVIGGIQNGTVIKSTDTLMDILKKMFVTVLKPTLNANPSCTMSNSGSAFTTYEVGTVVTPVLSASYTDGSFKSYKNSTTTEVKSAGCASGTTTFYYNNVALTGNTNTITLADGASGAYKASITYSASTFVPQTSELKDYTGLTIAANTATSSSSSYTGRYKYFVGHVASLPTNSTEVRNMNTYSGWIDAASKTVVGGTAVQCPVMYLAVCVPQGGSVTLQNELGAGWSMTKAADDITVNIGGTSTQKYSLYYASVNGAKYKNLTITKGTITNN